VLREGKIMPVHVQLYPTNKCNFTCGFCSCSKRNKNLELPLDTIIDTINRFSLLGCKAVTVTGGGEPTLHQNFNDVISEIAWKGLKVGLSTNGTTLSYLSNVLNKFTWIRISSSNLLPKQLSRLGYHIDYWLNSIENAVERSNVDWAFSYVVNENPDYQLIGRLVNFANNHNFTHVRLVNNILEAEKLTIQLDAIQQYLLINDINDSSVIYQKRNVWTKGTNPCYISLLKPVVGADGYVYPCCGVQYALTEPSRTCETETMQLCHINEIEEVWNKQKFFDGSECTKCYYGAYNQALHHMLHGVKHSEFI